MKKLTPSTVGFFEALGVAVYCALIVGIITGFEKTGAPPGFFGPLLMLVLLVFSAAVTGSLVFGYPAYLALHKKFKEAISVLAYAVLYFLGIILILLIVIIALTK